MADQALDNLSKQFDTMYAQIARPSIPPEKLLRAQLIQMLYSIPSERLLMDEIDYRALFLGDGCAPAQGLPALLARLHVANPW